MSSRQPGCPPHSPAPVPGGRVQTEPVHTVRARAPAEGSATGTLLYPLPTCSDHHYQPLRWTAAIQAALRAENWLCPQRS